MWPAHIYLWSMTSGKIIATTAYQLPVTGTAGLAFSPDGRTLAAAGDQGHTQRALTRTAAGPGAAPGRAPASVWLPAVVTAGPARAAGAGGADDAARAASK
jgi:hypothetical protein